MADDRQLLERPAAWWWLALGWWTLDGLASAGQYHFMRESAGSPVGWGDALRVNLTSAMLWVPLTVLAIALARRFPVGRGRWVVAAALPRLGAARRHPPRVSKAVGRRLRAATPSARAR